MKFNTIIAVATAAIVSFTATGAFAQSEKQKKQAEVRTKAEQTLADFFKADPKLKAEVGNAAGYAVFTTYGLSFLIGGAGGKGLVHDNKTKKVTYMDLAQASAGIQVGASDTRYLFVFKNEKELVQFMNSGWEASASAAAGAGAGKAGDANVGAGAGGFTGGGLYTLTKTGLQAGGAVAGTKVWKDKELN